MTAVRWSDIRNPTRIGIGSISLSITCCVLNAIGMSAPITLIVTTIAAVLVGSFAVSQLLVCFITVRKILLSTSIANVFALFSFVISFILLFSIGFGHTGLRDTAATAGAAPVTDPFVSIYFSAVTWATVGYGDFVPATTGARVLAIAEIVLSVFYNALVIAAIVQILGMSREPER